MAERFLRLETTAFYISPKLHNTYWVVDRMSSNGVLPWQGATSWQTVAKDKWFLFGVEEFLAKVQAGDPKNLCYFFMGFARGDEPFYPEVMYKRAAMSQYRYHIHVAGRIDLSETEHRPLDWESTDQEERDRLRFFLNLAGENSIDYWSRLGFLESFGRRIIFHQKVGNQNQITLKRTIFAFDSLAEALPQALELQTEVAAAWAAHTLLSLPSYSPSVAHTCIGFLKQARVPSMTVILPNNEDRKLGGVTDTGTVWVLPFAVANAQNVLSGVSIQPAKS